MKKYLILTIGLIFCFGIKSYSQANLNYFNGSQMGTNMQFNWQTSSENNMNYYEITFSTDDCITFTSISAFTPANGNTVTTSNYVYTLTGPLSDTCFCFQLVAVDFGGNQSYLDTLIACYNSTVASVTDTELNSSINLFPNPLGNNKLTIETENRTISNISIFNSIGQLILSKDNFESDFTLDIAYLEAGIYLIQMMDGHGQYHLRKLIKE